MTHATVFWELSYCALVWPRLTRPWVLLMAVLVHGGIVIALGMPTFGLVMLIGNLAFVSPKTVRKVFDPLARRLSLAVVGKATRAGAGRVSRLLAPREHVRLAAQIVRRARRYSILRCPPAPSNLY